MTYCHCLISDISFEIQRRNLSSPVLTGRFGQDLTVFQSAAMRARAKSAAAAAATEDGGLDEQPQQRVNTAVGSARPNGPGTSGGPTGGGGGRTRRRGQPAADVDQDAVDLQTWLKQPETHLSDLDEKGLYRIHHAAARGFVPVLQRAEAFNKQLLELKTSDGTSMTPLLVAVQVCAFNRHLFNFIYLFHRHLIDLFNLVKSLYNG